MLSYQNSPIPQSAENRESLPILCTYCWYAANGFIFYYALVSKLFRVFSIFTASSLVIGIPLLACPHSHYKTLYTHYCPMAVFCIHYSLKKKLPQNQLVSVHPAMKRLLAQKWWFLYLSYNLPPQSCDWCICQKDTPIQLVLYFRRHCLFSSTCLFPLSPAFW